MGRKGGLLWAWASLGIVGGLVVFALGASMLSVWALAGIAVSAAASIAYVSRSAGGRAAVLGMATGGVGSAVAWVAARLMMRWVAVSSGLQTVLTPEGTGAILATSLLMGLLPAMGYVVFARRFGHGLGVALGYGVLLCLLGGVPLVAILLPEIGAIAHVPVIPVGFLLAIPVLFALVIELAGRGLERLWEPGARR